MTETERERRQAWEERQVRSLQRWVKAEMITAREQFRQSAHSFALRPIALDTGANHRQQHCPCPTSMAINQPMP